MHRKIILPILIFMFSSYSCTTEAIKPPATMNAVTAGTKVDSLAGGTATATITSVTKRECHATTRSIDADADLGITAISHMYFLNENSLQLEGWGIRPRSFVPTPTRDPQADPHDASNRVTLKSWKYSLDSETASLLTPSFNPLLQNPCPGSCPIQIFSQSPDGQWQLLQVYDSEPDVEGIWLVNNTHKVKILEFIPFWSTWQWTVDNSLLWFQHSAPVYAERAMIVQLSTPPNVLNDMVNRGNTLNPGFYHVAVSGSEMSALSTENPRWYETSDNDELNVFDFSEVPPQQTDLKHIPGIAKVEWNSATNSYLLILSIDDIVEVREMDSAQIIQLPTALFDGYLAEEALKVSIPFRNHALSPSGNQLAVEYSANKILVFDCTLQ